MFTKTFLDFGKKNLVHILAFDGNSIMALLHERHAEKYTSDYPLIYMVSSDEDAGHTHFSENVKQSAFDVALKNNQVSAIKSMIKWVLKHQNSYVYSYLFRQNLVDLMEIGIEISDILDSDIFCYQFDFVEWPTTHTNCEKQIRAYNGTIFNLRTNYERLFSDIEDDKGGIYSLFQERNKLYKIKYTINIMPSVESTSLMDQCGKTSELDIFSSRSLS